ncbi:YdcF family protein [Listeria booriae]|uniref:YdcF family protein n=1 Tax=Listeria booriae TaxID=1552123 RepID=A0A7X0XDV5_9LIST|nr:YdcF family protein [Listeria booriae]MBC1492359.1 YdcF family protein [Listeria booriae]MBC1504258.1 YdcF family protein [Listeria booriae]MBC1525553.1 YdcF family protein [Listeria booriae]MBC6136086.1 YdcF family protein [Listeria booriae]
MRTWKKVILAIIGLGIVYISVVLGFIYSGAQSEPIANPNTILILGAKVKGDPAKPMPVLQERLDAAIPFIQKNKEAQVVVSGGQGSDESASEASVMKEYLIDKGVEASRIKVEDKSMRTEENLEYSKEKFDLGKTVIVTSEYHVYRALMLAGRQNIDATGLPSHTEILALLKGVPREVLSITYAWVFDW